MLKIVTLQEANGLLPLVKEHFLHIGMLLGSLHKIKFDIEQGHSTWKICPDSAFIKIIRKKNRRQIKEELKKDVKKYENLVAEELSKIAKLGAVIKNLFPPHIDFLSTKNNELIYLCWHGSEPEITHWHYLDDGSPIRKVINKEQEFGPSVVH